MLRINKQGFTLIELMVVIVIIGVLASLAIPRFTEASAKAKVAEAPRVIASYESAFLARVAETGTPPNSADDLIFQMPTSKWFAYKVTISKAGDNNSTLDDQGCEAKAISKMGDLPANTGLLVTKYQESTSNFEHQGSPLKVVQKMVPNFDAVKEATELSGPTEEVGGEENGG